MVTGGNRGIGFEICRQLVDHGVSVVLTSRSDEDGQAAIAELHADSLAAAARLDVTDTASVKAFASWLNERYEGIDILVNNAGILVDRRQSLSGGMPEDLLRESLDVNLFGAFRVTQALLPLMRRRPSGRIVNVSSMLAQLSEMGAGTPAYRISKTALNAFTRVLAAELSGDPDSRHIKVNAMSPGWVRTRMGGDSAPRRVDQGADTAIWLALLPDDGPTGGLFQDRSAIPW